MTVRIAGLKPRATSGDGRTRVTVASVAILAGWVTCGAGPALAQTQPTSGVFVHGGVFASIERQPHSELDAGDVGQTSPDPSGTVVGGTFGIGGFLTPRFTARLEVALPGELEAEEEQTVGRVSESSRTEVELRDVYVLLGYESDPTRRVRFSYLAGAVIRQQRSHRELTIMGPILPVIPPITIPPLVQNLEQTTVSYGTSVVLGLDATAMLGERAALVPQVRVIAAGGGLSFRPGVSLRWNF